MIFMVLIVSALVGLLLVLGVHASFAHSNKTDSSPLPTLYSAPEFSGLANWINSREIKSMRELRGKVVLVIYWSSGSAPSMEFHKRLKVLHKLYSADGLVMIGVNLDSSKPSFDKAEAQLGTPWVQCFDGEAFLSPMATAVGVTAIPSTVLVDRQGRVHALDLQGRRLRQAVVNVLGKR